MSQLRSGMGISRARVTWFAVISGRAELGTPGSYHAIGPASPRPPSPRRRAADADAGAGGGRLCALDVELELGRCVAARARVLLGPPARPRAAGARVLGVLHRAARDHRLALRLEHDVGDGALELGAGLVRIDVGGGELALEARRDRVL